jgi:hypothetical protein
MLLDPTETLRFAHDYDSWQKKCPRYGGSMLYLMLRREGFVVNHSGLVRILLTVVEVAYK